MHACMHASALSLIEEVLDHASLWLEDLIAHSLGWHLHDDVFYGSPLWTKFKNLDSWLQNESVAYIADHPGSVR